MRKPFRHSTHLSIVGAVACAIAFSIILSGCMPYTELKQESIVEGVGIDSNGSGGYDLTFQIYKPQQGGGGGQGQKSGSSSNIIILQSSGASLFDAVRNATLQTGLKLYFSNNRAYVIGADVCKSDFLKIIDFMERNNQPRDNEHIYIAKGKAADMLTYKKDDDYVPAENFEEMSLNNFQTSKTANIELFDVFKDFSNGITDPAIPAATLQKNQMGQQILELDGTAIFHNNSLAGYLDDRETRGFLWITGKVKGGIINLNLPQGAVVSMSILKSSSSIDTEIKNGSPLIKININLSSKIAEIQSSSSVNVDEDLKNKIDMLQNSAVKAEAQAAIDKALKTYESDIFGFGLDLYENQPKLWEKIASTWSTNSKNLPVQISVTSSVTDTGLTTETK